MKLLNNFNRLFAAYQRTNVKPDKQYSILPTILKLAGDLHGKTVHDFGCGSGFFTMPLAERAKFVIGTDSSEQQIKLANSRALPNTRFVLGDIFSDPIPEADVAVVPFVANYAPNVRALEKFFKKIWLSLNKGGYMVLAMDFPALWHSHFDWKKRRDFGAIKIWNQDTRTDETMFTIELFCDRKPVCTLHAFYYTHLTIQLTLQSAGFRNIEWHKPVVSKEGIQKLGAEFWDGYVDDPQLGYITAHK